MLRQASNQDNNALCSLSKIAPNQGIFRVFDDRTPDYFELFGARGDEAEVWVSESRNKIVGTVSHVYRNAKVHNQMRRIQYGCDFRVDPNLRRSRIGTELYWHMLQMGKEKADVGEVEIIANNNACINLLHKNSSPYVRIHTPQNINIHQIFQTFGTFSQNYPIRSAQKKDLEQISRLLQKQYENHEFCPDFSPESLENIIDRTPWFSLKDFCVAEYQGDIVAVAAFWDPYSLRAMIIEDAPHHLKFASKIFKRLEGLCRIPRIPKLGQPLVFLYMRFGAYEPMHFNALRQILNATHRVYHKNYHALVMSFCEGDPLNQLVKHSIHSTATSHIYHFEFTPGVISPCHNKLIYFDIAIV